MWLGGIPFTRSPPGPGVPEPDRWDKVKWSCSCASVVCGNPDQYIVSVPLGVFYIDIEVFISIEDAGVDQFVLTFVASAGVVLGNKVRVWKFFLWILVQSAHVGMSRGRVKVVVALLNVLTVISLGATQSEESLL